MKSFKHTPLDRSKECIRLLRFVDQPPSLELNRFSIETYDIATVPPFVALSYTWGRPEPTHDVAVNGSPLPIRENLWVALKALRDFFPNKARSLDNWRWGGGRNKFHKEMLQDNGYPLMWIDAICINQSDNLEKNHQVNMMGRIFSKADLAISWLGDEADDSSRIMKAIRATKNNLEYSFDMSQAMRAFANRPYWRRMWVIQEFVLPPDLIILCGNDGARWEDLLYFWHATNLVSIVGEATQDFRGEDVAFVSGGALAALISARSSRRDGSFRDTSQIMSGPISIDQIMTRFAYGVCSDPRDRIYALLALIEPQAGVEPLSADYKISAEELYYRVLGHVGPLENNADWRLFRKKLRKALNSFSWADAEAAKLHEILYELVGMDRSNERSFDFDPNKDEQTIFTEIQEYLANHLEQSFNGTLCEEDWAYLEKSCKGTICEGDWTYHDIIRRFEAFPRGEDPRAWHLFDNLLMRWLQILPASDDVLFRDDLSDRSDYSDCEPGSNVGPRAASEC